MELWIRSQDKKLLAKINYVYIQELSYKRKGKYEIQSNNGVLGYYNTQERALEVLDEIQNILKPQIVLSKVGKPIAETCDGTVYASPNEYELKELSTYVYEMPLD